MKWRDAVKLSKNKWARRRSGNDVWTIARTGTGLVFTPPGHTKNLLPNHAPDAHDDWEPDDPIDAVTRLSRLV